MISFKFLLLVMLYLAMVIITIVMNDNKKVMIALTVLWTVIFFIVYFIGLESGRL